MNCLGKSNTIVPFSDESSFNINPKISGSKTKNPPLIHDDSPLNFS